MKYEKLFAAGKIGRLELKNRIVMPAMGTSLAAASGEASDEMIAYYEERAAGGCGLIITEITRVDNETGVGTPNQLNASDLLYVPRLEKLARAVHRHDSRIFLQLQHPGRQNHGRLIGGRQIVAPSAVMSSAIGEMPRELTTEEVEALVGKFVFGAYIAQLAGIDGVEIHGAHGYLIGQFLSPLTNLRTDKYGGPLEGRMTFLCEIVQGIKKTCGAGFPVSVRIDGDEFVPGGITLEEALLTAQQLEKLGVDCINVSAGTYESSNTIIEPISYPQGWKKHLAAAMKQAVQIPVIACDVIRRPEFAESLLAEGNTDFVALGRALLADPQWGNKAAEGREAEIRTCISCLYCIQEVMECKVIKCAVNARAGRELEFPEPEQNGDGRVVAVVGGGPAGMEAARVLAERKFKPVLFEAREVLGGSVELGSRPPLKEKLNWFIDSMEHQLEQLHVDVRLSARPTAQELQALDPYAVFVAAGAAPVVPAIPGVTGENVCTVIDVLSGAAVIRDKRAVIIGSGMTGLETAEYLAARGNQVTVVEMQPRIGPDAYLPNLIDIVTRLKKDGVQLLAAMKLVEVKDNAIVLEHTATGEISVLETDAVVLSIGVRSERGLADELKRVMPQVKLLGDAAKPGRIGQAIQSGFETAYVLK
ncbi:FAD-dependent oxidoreductase [Paenibacillus sp. MMS20-IR301]|uniref:FAD-dependent oxidoreductase n=1 Tax=Paenibacillus sp. MMS20-IR301 TaxID=2895946 RepID=UPI0028E6D2C2|nr:FAD-dependent oxidoreductase [Paenibacillus sp. MMS20-IR301]WNS41387.1 FAD-dependent oxidoreductase [Paenibacillus sp. MMS20-IR301]